nr:immunoglobulin light chain junction region [Macaca mulatta]MOV94495.1 immunoglobulin light chain junction region [Macaca mulatta]MOV94604.1 immunoglobulin light chain junction region [Macaca mulatta]MOV94848.1 immunoglobulin light chain junction region [Macaca mulatta]MOV94910.1 immunoglobulin light chain junction region [Macaca mulatta]
DYYCQVWDISTDYALF